MTTMEIPPALSPARRPTPAGTRFVDVRANLMPPEVLSARQVDVVRRRVLAGLAGLVALLLLGFGVSWLQTNSARSDLGDLNKSIAAQQAQQGSYAKVADAQARVQASQQQLATLMTGDLSWRSLLDELRSAAPAGAALTSVGGSVTDTAVGSSSSTTTSTGATAATNAGATTAADPLNTSGKAVAGTLTLTGTAASAGEVATYAARLEQLKGITSVMITSVSGSDGTKNAGVTFSGTAAFTSDLLGGRWTSTSTTRTGGN